MMKNQYIDKIQNVMHEYRSQKLKLSHQIQNVTDKQSAQTLLQRIYADDTIYRKKIHSISAKAQKFYENKKDSQEKNGIEIIRQSLKNT